MSTKQTEAMNVLANYSQVKEYKTDSEARKQLLFSNTKIALYCLLKQSKICRSNPNEACLIGNRSSEKRKVLLNLFAIKTTMQTN